MIIATIPHPAIECTVMLMTDNLHLLLLKPQAFYLGWIQKQPVIQQLPSVCHIDVVLSYVCWMTGEAITPCQKYSAFTQEWPTSFFWCIVINYVSKDVQTCSGVFGCVEFESELRIELTRFLAQILISANQISVL